jgi:DNA mismatch endonuclease (patch repair protein)
VVDTRTPEQRRRIMQSVKTKDTGPEMAVRKILFSMGYRYRLHRKDLPGKPDIVLPGRHKAIFVHGCFWHGHECAKGKAAKSRTDYWVAKVNANRARDARNLQDMNTLGWESLVVWQCEQSDSETLARRLKAFVSAPEKPSDKK